MSKWPVNFTFSCRYSVLNFSLTSKINHSLYFLFMLNKTHLLSLYVSLFCCFSRISRLNLTIYGDEGKRKWVHAHTSHTLQLNGVRKIVTKKCVCTYVHKRCTGLCNARNSRCAHFRSRNPYLFRTHTKDAFERTNFYFATIIFSLKKSVITVKIVRKKHDKGRKVFPLSRYLFVIQWQPKFMCW